MLIKVCGMKLNENIALIALLQPDFMGFIFYSSSPRDVSTSLTKETLEKITGQIKKVAVFVNETLENVLSIVRKFGFTYVQLHGNETVEYCEKLKQKGMSVIKVFSIQTERDFGDIEKYSEVCDFFLFDTKSPKHGGTGQKFDWNLLENYKGKTPVLLSGGIGPEDVDLINQIAIKYTFIKGLDLNSKFENSPAIKDPEKLKKFINSVRN